MTILKERPGRTLPTSPTDGERKSFRWFGNFAFTVILTALVVGFFAGWAIYDANTGMSPAEIQSARWEAIVQTYESSPAIRAQARYTQMGDHYRDLWLAEQAAAARARAIQEARFAAMVEFYETHWPVP